MKRFVAAVLASTLILFLWSGITQILPWGVPTSQNITVQTDEENINSQVSNFVQLPPESLTTEEFDAQFLDKISTYTTDETFSWIVTQALNTNYTNYFVAEIITQLIVSIFLSGLLLLTVPLNLQSRMMIVVIVSLAAFTATFGQLMNWWRLPASYALGVGLNLLIGWTLSSFITARFIIKSDNSSTKT